jgi:2,4-dienoyl-CoA reductase-like NADH-dependent reductase (Old Yellow Enzyme family)
MNGPTLFDPVRLGDLELANRIVMAPMTRSRAGAGDAPTELAVEYYRQRATAGLIVTRARLARGHRRRSRSGVEGRAATHALRSHREQAQQGSGE